MNKGYSQWVATIGLTGLSAAALAGDAQKPPPVQEPAGFITGGVIGAFAAGPIGAIVGAGLGTWLGNRVHRASDAKVAEAQVAALQTDRTALLTETTQLVQANEDLKLKLDDLSQKVTTATTAQTSQADVSEALDGLEGDVLFRTGSAEITPQIAHQIEVLAQAVAKSDALKIRVDGYADPRGEADANMKLSEDRADAVRDLLLAAGIKDELIEVNAYGKSQSTAVDADGYALERRVRLTLRVDNPTTVVGANQ
jgi:outer membrane protein OmpA-like peptidoglycan-associated protein